MSMYHDTLLAKVGHSDPKYKPLLPSSPHTRYTRAWSEKDARTAVERQLQQAPELGEAEVAVLLRSTLRMLGGPGR